MEVQRMNIRPLYDRIVVKRIEAEEEKTASGLIIPDSAKEKPQEGEVVAVGKGKRLEDGKVVPLDVQVGDRILFGKYSGSDIKLDGDEYLIMREDEVLGISEWRRQEGEGLTRRDRICLQNRLFIAKIPARRFCAASTSWPTP